MSGGQYVSIMNKMLNYIVMPTCDGYWNVADTCLVLVMGGGVTKVIHV